MTERSSVWQGDDTDPATGVKLEETVYAYNRQGRMSAVGIDSDGDGNTNTEIHYRYDDAGIRVAETKIVDPTDDGDPADALIERTEYLIDHRNPSGYAQVLEERKDLDGDGLVEPDEVVKAYMLGYDVIGHLIAQNANPAVLTAAGVEAGDLVRLLYDAHGSTRGLVDALGQPLSGQIYRYDAFGVPVGFDTSIALTSLLYSGEQTDAATGLQYLRARYYDPATGRFNRLDPFAGDLNDPLSLHKYLYCHGNPVMGIDPSGLYFGFLSGFAEEVKFQTDRAMASLSALRSAYGIQRLVSIYQTATGAYAQLGYRAADFLVRSGPVIQKVTTFSGMVFVASTMYLACEEFGFVPRTGYTEFVVAASSTVFTAGLTLSEASRQLRGIIEPLRGTKDGRLLTGDMANKECLSRNPTWTANPYRPYTPAAEGRLAPGTRLVRFYTRGVTSRAGSFTTFAEDIEGLSYAQIQRKFALPFLPNARCYADGSGLRALIGVAGRNFEMSGNGRQVELLERANFLDSPFH